MKFVESSVKCITQGVGIEGMYKMIEDVARICYKSENKGNVTSKEFVRSLINKDHARPLEFGSVFLEVPNHLFSDHIEKKMKSNWSKIVRVSDKIYISTNYRVIIENKLEGFMIDNWSENISMFHYQRPCFVFDCSRSVGDEFRTHVTLSSVMESTRYCNYNKDKFGNEVTYIVPEWYKISTNVDIKDMYIESLKSAENEYLNMTKNGLQPQFARGVLPLDVKTTLAMCGFEDAWRNFLYRRCDVSAHPDAQKLANELGKLLKDL